MTSTSPRAGARSDRATRPSDGPHQPPQGTSTTRYQDGDDGRMKDGELLRTPTPHYSVHIRVMGLRAVPGHHLLRDRETGTGTPPSLSRGLLMASEPLFLHPTFVPGSHKPTMSLVSPILDPSVVRTQYTRSGEALAFSLLSLREHLFSLTNQHHTVDETNFHPHIAALILLETIHQLPTSHRHPSTVSP